jgi:lysophospholipase L1-like esterase
VASGLSARKRLLFTAILFGLVAGVAEVASFILASRIAARNMVDFRSALRQRIRATAAAGAPPYKLYKELYDPDLGWVYKTGHPVYGEAKYAFDDQGRVGPRPFATTRVSAYGDSFTLGQGVEADETWSQRLGQSLGTNVSNFGVGGYGTDQALLRLERDCRAGRRADVVVLGVLSENVNRILGNVRAFYTNDTCFPCFTNGPKPFFRKTAQGWELVRIGPRPSEGNLLEDVQRARLHDFWYKGISFPYTLGVIRWYRTDLHADRTCGPICVGRWDLEQARETMLFILRRFVELSREHTFRPVAVFIPNTADFTALERGESAGYQRFLPEARGVQDLTVVDVLEDGLKPEHKRYGDNGYDGHPSAEGHRQIAAALRRHVAPLLAGR